jgi:hypothetical protein
MKNGRRRITGMIRQDPYIKGGTVRRVDSSCSLEQEISLIKIVLCPLPSFVVPDQT